MSKRVGIKRSALQRLSENMNSISATVHSKIGRRSSKLKSKDCKKLKLKPDPITSFLKFKPNENNMINIGELSKPNTTKRLGSRTWIPPLKVGNDSQDSNNKIEFLARNDLRMAVQVDKLASVKHRANISKSTGCFTATSSTYDVNEVVEKINCKYSDVDTDKDIYNPFNEVCERTINDKHSEFQPQNHTVNCQFNTTDNTLINKLTNSPISKPEDYNNSDINIMKSEHETKAVYDDTKNVSSNHIKKLDDINCGYQEHKLEFGLNTGYSITENQLDEKISSEESQETIYNPNDTILVNDPDKDIEMSEGIFIQHEEKKDSHEDVVNCIFNDNKTLFEENLNTDNYPTSTEIKMKTDTQITSLKEKTECGVNSQIDLTTSCESDNEISVESSQRVIFHKEQYKLDDILFTDKKDFRLVKDTNMFENGIIKNAQQDQEITVKLQENLTTEHQYSLKSTNNYLSNKSQPNISENNNSIRSQDEEKFIQMQTNINNSLNCTQQNDNFQSETTNDSIDSCKSVIMKLSEGNVQEIYRDTDCINEVGDTNDMKYHDIATQDTVIIEGNSNVELETSFEIAVSKHDVHNITTRSSNSETDSVNYMVKQIHNSQESKLDSPMKNRAKGSVRLTEKDVIDISDVSNNEINEYVEQQKNYEDLIDCNDEFYNIHMSEVIKIENEYKETSKNITTKLQSVNDYESKGHRQRKIVNENLPSASTNNDYVALPLPQLPRLDWIKKQNEQKQRLRSVIQEINALNSMVLQVRKEIWPEQFNMKHK